MLDEEGLRLMLGQVGDHLEEMLWKFHPSLVQDALPGVVGAVLEVLEQELRRLAPPVVTELLE